MQTAACLRRPAEAAAVYRLGAFRMTLTIAARLPHVSHRPNSGGFKSRLQLKPAWNKIMREGRKVIRGP
jgi:hypothetical protein